MAWLKDTALAVLGKGWDAVVSAAKWLWDKLVVIGNTVYDPPPRTIRFFFWSFIVILALSWGTFAFVNSWFYKPTVAFFTSIDTGDVVLPEYSTFLPEAVPPLPELKPSLICEDMSDTPANCKPAETTVAAETVEPSKPVAANLKSQNVTSSGSKLQKKAKRKPRKVKPVSPQDYFCAGFQC